MQTLRAYFNNQPIQLIIQLEFVDLAHNIMIIRKVLVLRLFNYLVSTKHRSGAIRNRFAMKEANFRLHRI